MECQYCKDKILEFQPTVKRIDRDEKETVYHKGCYRIWLDEIVDKVGREKYINGV